MGSLTVVGSGIRFAADMTLAAQGCIRAADRVFFGVDDIATVAWLRTLNPNVENLVSMVQSGHARVGAYEQIAEVVIAAVRRGEHVCMVLYGHPGFYVYPSHLAIAQARAEGYPAEMLAGVSALDWFFADLGIDPSTRGGLRIHGAAEWLVRRRLVDTGTDLLLMQVGLLSAMTWRREHAYGSHCVALLRERLCREYGPEHPCVAYVASSFAQIPANKLTLTLGEIRPEHLAPETTLYVPRREDLELDERDAAALAEARAADAAMPV
jgi:precorrin-2 methylase